MNCLRIFFTMLFLTVVGWCGNAAVSISEKGHATASVVVSDKAIAAEKYAAAELTRILKQMCGGEFIVNGTKNLPFRILVGPDAARLADPGFSADRLGPDGIVIRTKGRDLILAGGRPRGTLYAVFQFLEQQGGCRWWSGKQQEVPAESLIPIRPDFSVEALNICYVPPFEFREPYWGYNLSDADWCVRNQVFGRITKTGSPKSNYGGAFRALGHIQSFWYWISPKEYFASHPEYFSEIDGKRIWKNPKGSLWADRETQLCMTNPDVAELIAAKMIKRIEEKKGNLEAVTLAPNDWNNPCQCAECCKVYEQEGAYSGALLVLLNRVAEKLGKKYPHVILTSGAYMWYQAPPRNIRPRRNVNIWFVTQGFNQCENLDAPRNRHLLERLEKWAALCRDSGAKLYVWDHSANFAHYLVPLPNLFTWKRSMELYRKLGVQGIWFLGCYSRPNMELEVVRNYLMAKLLWNPDQDADLLLKKIVHEYYGAAGPAVWKYLVCYHDAYRTSGQSFSTWNWSPLENCRFLSYPVVNRCREYLNEAADAIKGNPEYEVRVLRLKIAIWYLYLIRWDEWRQTVASLGMEWPYPEGMSGLLKKFNTSLKPAGIIRFAEGARSWWPSIEERAGLGETPQPPPGCEKKPRHHWVRLTPDGFHPPKDYPIPVVKDASAPGGRAVRIVPGKKEITLQRPLWNIPLNHAAVAEQRKVRLFVSLKGDCREDAGNVCSVGVRYRKISRNITGRDLADGKYHIFDLGIVSKPSDWTHIFLTIPGNLEHVKSISLGQAWLVME